ncbi:diacylglycerol/lipid kinase family protein [Furfurilactobacillus siliginis]|uniref:Diacylglycerol kinase n=1 Tax=Furfurilactobacillus siliginis TaxID=348151 RepID=A0A0R2KZM1_9LACO|nr:diacylglycerol kinase family protein [Furfurilactobacillus siliginis]KRN94882.1 diacylglycerol kinase catalytic domain protein [Furfurilactobacillus siliginis]GEK28454.1 diacylglycerol kinase [Furfurilactobacillus siliginis]
MSRHFYVILNRHAGRGRASKIWDAASPKLKQAGITYQLAETRYPGHATLLAELYAKRVQPDSTDTNIVLVVGGDGTLNQTLNGLKLGTTGDPLPIAYLPAGSGNDFARGAGISRNPDIALQQIISATEPTILDIGHYDETIKHEHRYFVNNVGIGFDAAVVSAANHSSQKGLLNHLHIGSLAYMAQLAGVLTHQDAFPVTLQIDDQREVFNNGFLLTTSNHPYFGGGVRILPIASVTDGKLSVIIVEKMRIPRFIFLFMMMGAGRHLGFKQVHHYQAEKIHLSVSSLEHGQVDGEEMGSRSFDIYLTIDQYPFWFTQA